MELKTKRERYVVDAEWVAEALRSIQRDPQGLPILDLPYLVLMKIQAGRAQDLARRGCWGRRKTRAAMRPAR